MLLRVGVQKTALVLKVLALLIFMLFMLTCPRQPEMLLTASIEGNEESAAEVTPVEGDLFFHHFLLQEQ